MSEIVTLTRCDSYERGAVRSALERHLELLGGLGRFVSPGDNVLLKPNFIAPKSRRKATQTDPAVIVELARILKDFGAKPFIGDSPAWGTVRRCIRALGMEDELAGLDVAVRQLNRPRLLRVGRDGARVGISQLALDADVIINLPKFKSHRQMVATFAVKNIFGAVCGKQKAYWHFAKGKSFNEFCRFLIDIFKLLDPAVTIIDAVTVMDGPGPITGRARPLGWIIGGNDPIACEAVCCRLVGMDPLQLPMIAAADSIGFGVSRMEDIRILGDDLPPVPCQDFELPDLIPLRFSLPHVCRSIYRQAMMLARKTAP